ncbi:MAG: sugar transferase, partial [Hyphomicrobium sp.]|uniref:sugar transferase n=1 Tax=Hyphomicrobium sp. TaxID=82 RepID=UPI003D13314C
MVGFRSAAERATDEPALQDTEDPRWPLEAAASTHVPQWKRVLDVAIVIAALPFLLPLLIAVAISVKLGSKGPVLFKQVRIGHLGKPFVIFKFRTMTAGTDVSVHERHVADLINLDQPMTKLDARDSRLVP